MSVLKYRILSHTADLRLEVFGKTLEEFFGNAAEAIAHILSPKAKLRKSDFVRKSDFLKLKSANLNTLLVDFLNEILSRSHINKRVYKVKSLKAKGNLVEAEIVGHSVEEFDEDIKAVTYHEVQIEERGKGKAKGWHTKLVLDI